MSAMALIAVSVALVALLGSGRGPAQAGAPPPAPYYRCFGTLAGDNADAATNVHLGSELEVGQVGVGRANRICFPALKNGAGNTAQVRLRCFGFSVQHPFHFYKLELESQFGTSLYEGGILQSLCVPMVKGPIGAPPPGPYWTCYAGGAGHTFTIAVESQFGSETGVTGSVPPFVGYHCVPALKASQGDLFTPALECAFTEEAPIAGSYSVVSQFAIETGVAFDTSEDDTGSFCVPATIIAVDADDDDCTAGQEAGSNPAAGGQRDDFVFWDFFDTPTPPSYTRDAAISVADIAAVVARFGSSRAGGAPDKETALLEAHTPPPSPPAYHVGYDRTPAAMFTGPPDGATSVQDIALNVQQFGHSCMTG
jgi:hypothetical protein